MKLKRIMAMVLCFAMVLSTMSFNVFAEDTTDYSDVISSVESEVVQDDLTLNVKFNGIENNKVDSYDGWWMNIYFTANKDLTLGSDGDGYLTLSHPTYDTWYGSQELPNSGTIEYKAGEKIKILDYYWAAIGMNFTQQYQDMFTDALNGVTAGVKFLEDDPDLYGEISLEIYEIIENQDVNHITLASQSFGSQPVYVAELWRANSDARSTETILVGSYESLEEALEAAQDGDIIKVIDDFEIENQITVDKAITLNLNGCTISSAMAAGSSTNHIYAISNNSDMVIMDSVGEGSIDSRGIYNYGKLTLESGTINAIDGNGGYAINNEEGSTFVMNGGVVATTYEDDYKSDNGGYDATPVDVPAACTATLNGGKIINVSDFTFAVDTSGTLNIPADSTIEISGTHGAIAVSGGTTTINAGTFTIPKDEYTRTDNVVYVSGGAIVINGGTFIGDSDSSAGGTCVCDTVGTAVINDGDFSGSSGGDVLGTTGTTINGGTFENLVETSRVAVGATITNGDKTYTMTDSGLVEKLPSVAKIGDAEYNSLEEAFAAAQEGDTIKLLADCEKSGRLVFQKSITIDLNGYDLTVTGDKGISVSVTGNLTVTGEGRLTGETSNTSGTGVNISGNLTVSGNASVVGTGGIFGVNVSGDLTVKNDAKVIGTGNSAGVYVTGAQNYAAENNGSTVTLTAKPDVAFIGETGYETLAAAITAATKGDTIVLADDIAESVTIKKDLTIDGANKKFSGNILVEGNKKVTVKNVNFADGTGYAIKTNGANEITVENCKADNYAYGLLHANKSTNKVVMKSVEVTNCSYGLHWVNGNVGELEKVTMTNVTTGIMVQNISEKTITLKECSISAERPIHVWEKGTAVETFNFEGTNNLGDKKFTISDYAKLKLADENSSFATSSEGLIVTSDNPKHSVVYEDGVYKVGRVAKIREIAFITLADAIKAVSDGDVITILSDIAFNEFTCYESDPGKWYEGLYYDGDKSFTIDLNGKTITNDSAVNDYLLYFKNNGAKDNTINIKNGTIEAASSAYSAIATASANVNKITINLDNVNVIGNNRDGAVLKIRGGSVLNVNDGTVITGKDSYTGIEAAGEATIVNINDGVEIYQNGTSSSLGALAGVSHGATLNVKDGSGESANCGFIAMTSGGTINIYGGEWIALSTDESQGVISAQNDKGAYPTGVDSVINVTDGLFKGYVSAWTLGRDNEVSEVNITGGMYTHDVSAYTEAGYETKNAGSIWKVVPTATPATVKAYSETSKVKAGDKVTVQVIADGFEFTNGDWELRYDPTMFELDANATKYYSDTTRGVKAEAVKSTDENTLAGKVIAVGGSLKQGNEIPSGTVLATYTFTALPQSKATVSGKFDIVNAHINTYDYAVSQTNVPAECVDLAITITREGKVIIGSLEVKNTTYNGDIQKGNAFVVDNSVVGKDSAVITYSVEENGIYTKELPTFKEAGSYKIWVKVNVDGYAEYKAEHEYMSIGAKDIELSLEVAAGAAYNSVEVKPVITDVYDAEFKGKLKITGVDYEYEASDFIYIGNNMAIAKEAKAMDVVAGKNEVTITYTSAQTDNYASASETTNVDADKAFTNQTTVDALNAAADAAVTYTYNGTEHKAQDKIAAPEGWTVAVTRINDSTVNPGVTNVADKEFVEIRFTHDNYNDVVVSRVLKVDPLDLTIIVPDFEKGAGEADDFTTQSVTYTSENFVASDEFTTVDTLVAIADLNVTIVRKTFGEDAGNYDLTASYTPNANYSPVVIDDGKLTIGMPSDTKIEVVNNEINGNGNHSADYVAGYRLVLVYTNTATARYTYDDGKMFDLSEAGYEYFDNTKSIDEQTEDNYKYVYGIIVKGATGADDAYYTDKVDFIGTNKYAPEKIVYDADINFDDKFSQNDISDVNGVLNGEYDLDAFFMYYFLKADYDRTDSGDYKSDKMVKIFDVQEVQKFINTKTTIQ